MRESLIKQNVLMLLSKGVNKEKETIMYSTLTESRQRTKSFGIDIAMRYKEVYG